MIVDVALIRLEKRVDELLKQNASLETLSKGQEQALTKKEKQLQVSALGTIKCDVRQIYLLGRYI